MNCKFCNAELEEGITLCPICGKDNKTEDVLIEEENIAEEIHAGEEAEENEFSEAEMSEEEQGDEREVVDEQHAPVKKMTANKLAVIYISVIAVLAVLVALVVFSMKGNSHSGMSDASSTTEGTIPEDGNPDDVSCQGSYTVSDRKAKSKADKVIATGEGVELTNGALQTFYWLEVFNFASNYGDSASYYGIDFDVPLDRQGCPLSDQGWTWQQYFLNVALENWHMYHSFCQEAEATAFDSGMDMQEYLENAKTSLEESASNGGYDSADAMIKADMGAGASVEDYLYYLQVTEDGYAYYESICDDLNPTEEQIRTYYEENLEMFEEKGVTDDGSRFVDVRHILLQPTETDDEGEYTEDAWATCEAEARALMEQWEAGDKTEDSFGALANEHSEDPGSNTVGGLYEYVEEGKMVTEFNDWCFDESRQYGDYDIVKTSYGYHLMYFVQSQPVWYVYAQEAAKSELISDTITSLLEKYPVEIDYSKIVLGFVDLTA